MMIDHETGKPLLWALSMGFALLVLLLLASGFVAIESMRSVESGAELLVAEEDATIRLINKVQGEEGNLSSVFYDLVDGRKGAEQEVLLRRLDALENELHETTAAGIASRDSALWNRVRQSADDFILEGREILRSGQSPSRTFYRKHEILLDSLADLASSSFVSKGDAQRRETENASSRIRSSVFLLAIGLVVAVAGAIFTARSVLNMFRRLSWQTAELARLSSRVMSDQEETARRLSHEMHDHFGQTLSAIEANLVAMKHKQVFDDSRMEDCLALVKDAVGNVREVSQLLRPSMLDDFGLDASLQWLVSGFAERTGIHAQYRSSFQERLGEEEETQLFRITQEALTNIARHAAATEVHVDLTSTGSKLRLSIRDNGKGLPLPDKRISLGLTGMRARARAAGGHLQLESQPGKGVAITVEIPLAKAVHHA